MHGNKSTMSNKCTAFAGHFDGHAPYRPGGRHGHRFWLKKLSCGVVKPLF
jgi:hypothetical protein